MIYPPLQFASIGKLYNKPGMITGVELCVSLRGGTCSSQQSNLLLFGDCFGKEQERLAATYGELPVILIDFTLNIHIM
jgi:hypothetical protein